LKLVLFPVLLEITEEVVHLLDFSPEVTAEPEYFFPEYRHWLMHKASTQMVTSA